ncbi:Uncharacterized protein TCAP_04970 [Tolypocladium capitatum]|uniref:Glyoxalase/fosfomycin resistance/dioxygenase domain-containing protein n=1 Tax=Tolypocladium capitatum TaxID=45235 RepID=A0A2K3QC42_9HYPO|nr:Uncharacterized protein TCAP_04970 [Tolypocladium capitatum]
MSDWKPPPFGTPTWMGIPAKDMARASEFYKTVFNLPFMTPQPAYHPENEVRLFDFSNESLSLTGGILQTPDKTGVIKGDKGGICVYWFVEDVEESAKIIEAAGGKMLSDKVMVAEFGAYRYFEDTEGTVGAVYMMVK